MGSDRTEILNGKKKNDLGERQGASGENEENAPLRRIDLSKTFVVTKDENGELGDNWVPYNEYYKDKELKK